jgi:CDP-6-deoxy-D-xylo-4-hexulose-3-dehydrase
MGTQPVYTKRFGRLELPNVSIVDKYGCYIPNHPELTKNELHEIVNIVNTVMRNSDA